MQGRLITSFRRLSEADMQVRARRIVAALTDNPHFPAPWPAQAPSLAQLSAAVETYSAAQQASLTRDMLRITARNVARRQLEELLRRLGAYLEFAAQGDLLALQSTGFELHQERVRTDRSVPPPAPENLRVQRGLLSGQLDLRFTRAPGAGSYEVQVAQGDPGVEANWHQALLSTTCTGLTLRDLPTLQNCWVRVRGLIGQSFGPWSAPVGVMVL